MRVERRTRARARPSGRLAAVVLEPLRRLGAQVGDLARELDGARGRLAEPERDRRRRALRVGHPHDARLDAADAPAVRAQQEHVAGHALDRPVLVHGADVRVVGVEHDLVVAELRDRAARAQRREARAAPPAQRARSRWSRCRYAARRPLRRVEAVASASRARRRSPRARARDTATPRARARRARPRSSRRRRRPPRSAARGCRAAPRAARSGRAGRRAPRAAAPRTRPARRARSARAGPSGAGPSAWPERPIRCSAVAMLRGEPIWQTSSISPMSMPSSSDAVATSARSSPALSRASTLQPALARQAAVVRGDVLGADPLAEPVRQALGQAARVGEDQRRAVRRGVAREHLDQVVPLLLRGDRGQVLARRHRRSRGRGRAGARGRAPCTAASSVPTRKRAIRSIGRCVAESPMRTGGLRGSASSRASESARCEPRLSRASAWISSTITVRAGRQQLAAALRGRASRRATRASSRGCAARGAACPRARRAACRPCARRRAAAGSSSPIALRLGADLGERRLEVALDVVRERAQRRDVDRLDLRR